jgi:hypothetical protein
MKIVITEVPEQRKDFFQGLRTIYKTVGLREAMDIYDYVLDNGSCEVEVQSVPTYALSGLANVGIKAELVDSKAPKTIIVTYSGREAYVYETVGEVSELIHDVRSNMAEYDGLVPLEPNTLIHVDRIEMLVEIQED